MEAKARGQQPYSRVGVHEMSDINRAFLKLCIPAGCLYQCILFQALQKYFYPLTLSLVRLCLKMKTFFVPSFNVSIFLPFGTMVYTAGMLKTAMRNLHSSAKGVSWFQFSVNCVACSNMHIPSMGKSGGCQPQYRFSLKMIVKQLCQPQNKVYFKKKKGKKEPTLLINTILKLLTSHESEETLIPGLF